jgi:hypothetical protein
MNNILRLALMALSLAGLCGCADEAFNRGMYEGFRVQRDSLRPIDGVNAPPNPPDFDRYDAERRKLHPAPADATLEVPAAAHP